ncbi:MAG TPA: hypothetical protein PKA31_01980 [Candidatus Moranbacteria bacterium]|nr:hypothetical protein [Candidatus Moranbacteria bacterium]
MKKCFPKTKNRSEARALAAALFVVLGFIMFANNSFAATNSSPDSSFPNGGCSFNGTELFIGQYFVGQNVDGTIITLDNCCDIAKKVHGNGNCNVVKPNGTGAVRGGEDGSKDKNTIPQGKGPLETLVSFLLEQVFTVVGWLMGIAAIIFD